MKKYVLSAAVVLAASQQALAGATNTQLKCQSGNGKVELSGHVPGDFAEFHLTATVKGNNGTEKIELLSEVDQESRQLVRNARLTIIEDLENRVYALQAEDLHEENIGLIRLYAIPKTVKVTKSGLTTRSSFQAKLSVSSENGGAEEVVSCTTIYEL
ncbi:MAG: hypothetical protein AB7G93_03330 [Bdellovibrionales bacterium]